MTTTKPIIKIALLRGKIADLEGHHREQLAAVFPEAEIKFLETTPQSAAEHSEGCKTHNVKFVILQGERPIPAIAMEEGVVHLVLTESGIMQLTDLNPGLVPFNGTPVPLAYRTVAKMADVLLQQHAAEEIIQTIPDAWDAYRGRIIDILTNYTDAQLGTLMGSLDSRLGQTTIAQVQMAIKVVPATEDARGVLIFLTTMAVVAAIWNELTKEAGAETISDGTLTKPHKEGE